MKQWIVDAFTDKLFNGNQAAVCVLPSWPADSVLQNVAKENNLSETAYLVRKQEYNEYELRWFTPAVEVELCGHATLAAAWVLYNKGFVAKTTPQVQLYTRWRGVLTVSMAEDGFLAMSFPRLRSTPVKLPDCLKELLDPADVVDVVQDQAGPGKGGDMLIAVKSPEVVKRFQPNDKIILQIPMRGVLITAPLPEKHQYCLRGFFPAYGISEDPVTGSAHCLAAPYWFEKWNTKEDVTLTAHQICPIRSGVLRCQIQGDRVILKGEVQEFSEAVIKCKL